MKPLTRGAAWVSIGLATLQGVQYVVWYLKLPPEAPAIMRSPSGLVFGEVSTAFLILCGVALLRQRAWGWWAVVVVSFMGNVGSLSGKVDRLTRDAPPPAWSAAIAWPLWIEWSLQVVGVLLLVAFLLDPPRRWRQPNVPTLSTQEPSL